MPIRFVQVGSASGADITLPGAVLRASAIELMGSGIGSIAPTSVPLSEVERAWDRAGDGRRVVFVTGA